MVAALEQLKTVTIIAIKKKTKRIIYIYSRECTMHSSNFINSFKVPKIDITKRVVRTVREIVCEKFKRPTLYGVDGTRRK